MQVDVEGTPRALHPIVRDETYRIAGEALRNAFRHAQAKQIEVELRYDEHQFRLRIRDDGRGIDPEVLTAEGREGHFGLPGMRERAKLVSGMWTVWSVPDSGTEIEIYVPAVHAYSAVVRPGVHGSLRGSQVAQADPAMSSHDSPIRIRSIDARPVTSAAEADAVRWHAGFQAAPPADRRHRRLKVDW